MKMKATIICMLLTSGGNALANVEGSDIALATKWEVSGFEMPESVFAVADHPWLYVSNVNGAEQGFISRVAKSGTIDNPE